MRAKGKLNKKEPKKTLTADQIRLKSIAAKKEQFKNHQKAIKSALANLDVKSNSKVVFDDSSDEISNEKAENGHSKPQLFDDDDGSEDEYNFDVKEQFEGKKGKKLLELQSKYKNDKRFTLDERFIEDDDLNSDNDNVNITKDDLVQEKEADLAVLEEILGKRISKEPEKIKKSSKAMIRYDPTNPDFANLEVQKEVKPTKKRKRKEKEEHEEKQEEIKEVPGTFYEVKGNLKETLQESEQPFSLLNMFGRVEPEEVVEENEREEVIEHNVNNIEHNVKDKNPFRYDSSDNESDGEKDSNIQEIEENHQAQKKVNLGPRKLWTDPFFFKDDDYRFEDGFDFIKKFENDHTEFSTIRRNIKEIVKAKVKHNQKKNRMFKRKLGGKKLIKMKKALKR